MSAHPSISPIRFLRASGILPLWAALVYLTIAVCGITETVLSGRSEAILYLWLFHLPIAAGTGLLTIAREGRLDLLFAAGITRPSLWCRTFLVSVIVPTAIAIAIAPAAMPHVTLATWSDQAIRVIAIAAFTGSIGFAFGLVQPRYAAGVAWLAMRLVVLLSRWGLDVLAQLRTGVSVALPMAQWRKLAMASLLFPELLLDPRVPMTLAILPACAGIVAALIAYRIFLRADFGGRRQSQ